MRSERYKHGNSNIITNKMSRDLELEQQIDAYIKGKLTEEEARQLWEQLLQRPDYIELLETELGVRSILKSRSSTEAAGGDTVEDGGIIHTLYWARKWIAAAAAVAILVVSINILQVDTTQSLIDSTIKDIDLSENLSTPQILRSQKLQIAPADSLLNRGFEAAISGEVAEALKLYNKIIEEYGDEPAAVQAHLNKGIIQYNSGKYGDSIISFRAVVAKVTDTPFIKEKAYWYMGNAYINIERLAKARDAIHSAYALDGIYRKSAYRLLRKLDYKLGNVDFDDYEQQMKEQ